MIRVNCKHYHEQNNLDIVVDIVWIIQAFAGYILDPEIGFISLTAHANAGMYNSIPSLVHDM